MDKHNEPAETDGTPVKGASEMLREASGQMTEQLLREAGVDPAVFYANFEFVDDVLRAFMAKIEPGLHIMKSTFPGNNKMLIVKTPDGEIKISGNASGFAIHLAIAMVVQETFGLELRTYFNGGSEDPASLSLNTPQELRGWLVSGQSLDPLTSQQCIDVHCVDPATGKLLDPERNVAYRDGWSLVSKNQDESKTP